MAATLALEALSVGYRPRRRSSAFELSDIADAVKPGELVCLLGPNGSGKSTLLRTIAGFHPPLAGRVLLGGRPAAALSVNERARFIGVVLTERVDPGLLDARELVSLGRYPYTTWSGRLASEDRRVVEWAIEAVGAAPLAARTVASLSDGERQKVMIARALAQEPRLLLLDEPTAFLDLPRKVEVMELLGRVARENGCAVLLSTHEIEIAQTVADRLWLILPRTADTAAEGLRKARRGGRFASGSPEDLVLSGEFARLFAGNGVTYDRLLGRFRFGRQARGRAILRGSGVSREWTERALRRVGVHAVDSADEAASGPPLPVVAVRELEESYLWTLSAGGSTREFGSISELLAALADSWIDEG